MMNHRTLNVLCATLLIALTACGGGGGPTTGSVDTSAQSNPAVTGGQAGTTTLPTTPSPTTPTTTPPATTPPTTTPPTITPPATTPPATTPPPTTPSGTTACDSASGTVIQVGPTRAYVLPSQAAAVAQNGNVIEIDAGTYIDVASWSADNLTICGKGGRAIINAGGQLAQGKAIWVISGANNTVDSVEFHNAAIVPALSGNGNNNAAGIRAQHTTGNFAVINSGFYDNEDGILGGLAGTPTTITVDRSEFARNGYGDGYTHNIYIGQIASLTVTSSYFHEAKVGHNLKSRAQVNHIENSYFMDGANGTASYTMDFPNAGQVILRGNLLQKGTRASNSIVISYGEDGTSAWTTNTLHLSYNTLVDAHTNGAFIAAPNNVQTLTLTANLFAATSNTPTTSFTATTLVQQNNVTGSATNIPGAGNITTPNFWPDATLLATLNLSTTLDATYTHDSPQPWDSRALSGPAKVVGALQSSP